MLKYFVSILVGSGVVFAAAHDQSIKIETEERKIAATRFKKEYTIRITSIQVGDKIEAQTNDELTVQQQRDIIARIAERKRNRKDSRLR